MSRYDEIREQELRTKEHYEAQRTKEFEGEEAPEREHKAVRR